MTQRDLFDAVGRLPESYRLEAMEDAAQDSAAEINALFEESTRHPVKAVLPDASAESQSTDIRDIQPAAHKKAQNPIRNLTIGLTAIAAAVALMIGAMVWRVHQETIETIGSPADSVRQNTDTEINVQTDEAGIPRMEITTAGDTEQTQDITHTEPLSGDTEVFQTTATNIFGGRGALRVVGKRYGLQPITEDEDYWYIGGSGRISKTAENQSGHLHEELLCQTPGCLHDTPECLRFRYYDLITDGVYLYEQRFEQNGYMNDDGSLIRINPDGSRDIFYYPERDKLIAKYQEEGRTVDASDPFDIRYVNIIRLGSSGNYLIEAYWDREDDPQARIWINMFFTPETEKTVFLPFEAMNWQYDEAGGQLFGIRSQDSNATSKGLARDAQFSLYDIRTGECLKQSNVIPNMSEAVLMNGSVYYIRTTSEEQKFIVDGEDRGGRLVRTAAFCTYDFETGKATVLQDNIDFGQINLCGGKLLCLRQSRVGKDQLFYLDPEDMSEKLIFETPNKITNVCCAEPDFIELRNNSQVSGNGFLIDGELKKVEFGNF